MPAAISPAESRTESKHGKTRQHLLGISLEDYFQVGAFRGLIEQQHWGRFESRLERATDATLNLLDSCDARATFFTLGWVAEHLPELDAGQP